MNPINDISSIKITNNESKSENIQVFIRIRPLVPREQENNSFDPQHYIKSNNDQTIEIRSGEHNIKCTYDGVLDSTSSQEKIYENIKECTQSVLNGFNSTLFAYGQTGSGKSYTMFGPKNDMVHSNTNRFIHTNTGIIPRAILDIFNGIKKREKEEKINIYCSFVQIYNENLYDLLRDCKMDKPLIIHEDPKTGIYVEGLSEYSIKNPMDCMNLLDMGETNRAVRATYMNQVSSRSHSVFQLSLEKESIDTGIITKSKLNLIDLAGSEKWNIENNMKNAHINEMNNINLSLHTLGRCIASLSSKSINTINNNNNNNNNLNNNIGHIPYRDSKLTRLLQDSLGGNTKTKIIATLSPSIDCIDESISTLKFADRAKQVMVHARINQEKHIDMVYVEKLEKENTYLKGLLHTIQSSIPSNSKDLKENNDVDDFNNNDRSSDYNIEMIKLSKENMELRQTITTFEKQKKKENNNVTNASNVSNDNNILIHPSTDELKQLREKNQVLEDTIQKFIEITERFFKFEIEEEELKNRIENVFRLHRNFLPLCKSPLSLTKEKSTNHSNLSITNKQKANSSGYNINNLGINKQKKIIETGFRIRGKTGETDERFENDTITAEKEKNNIEKEILQAKKEISKQEKLQAWLLEKEKREILKLKQEQEYFEEQKRLIAEKDERFLKRAKMVKKQLMKRNQENKENKENHEAQKLSESTNELTTS